MSGGKMYIDLHHLTSINYRVERNATTMLHGTKEGFDPTAAAVAILDLSTEGAPSSH
jgi:hypothetical protein